MATTLRGPALAAVPDTRWRTRDIVVAAVVGVAFGIVFWAWNLWWDGPIAAIFSFAPPLRDLAYAIWLVPAVLAPLIVRKPGAALFAELVAAGVSAILGSPWGVDTILSGFVQGAGGRADLRVHALSLVDAARPRAWRPSPAPRPPGSMTGRSTTRTSISASSWSAAC